MKVAIALQEYYSEAIDHFRRVANSSQDYFKIETVELTSSEESRLEQREIPEDKEEEIYKKLFQIKIAHGYKPLDLFIAFFQGRLLNPEGKDYFLWPTDLEDENPGVCIISLSYLKTGSVLDNELDQQIVFQSIELNMLYAIISMATSLEGHYETTGCVLDFCRDMRDINFALKQGFVFCDKKNVDKIFKVQV